MGAEAGEQETPLLYCSLPSNSTIKRTGTVWTAVAHIITGVIGSGILSLAWSMAQLGWIAGPLAMSFFASVALVSTFLTCDCYRSPDPELGPTRNRSFLEAVHETLGERNGFISSILTKISFYGTGIAYTVTTAISLRNRTVTTKMDMKLKQGGASTLFMLLFGAVQVVLSQIPDFHHILWLSIFAAIMSVSYASIGSVLGFAQIIENGYVKGGIAGVSADSAADKVWKISQALGDIAYAYPYTLIALEIQDTLKSPPSENKTMKKASIIAFIATTFFYLCFGSFGYAAFGENTPGNLLTGFHSSESYWLVDLANACIVLHLVGGYQVSTQPVFANIEKWIAENSPNSRVVTKNFTCRLPWLPAFQLNLLRLCFRTIYVASTTTIAMIFPYFNQIIGLLGGLKLWTLSIYFPVEMYFKQRNVEAWSTKWIMLRAFSMICLLVSAFIFTGSVEGLIKARFS